MKVVVSKPFKLVCDGDETEYHRGANFYVTKLDSNIILQDVDKHGTLVSNSLKAITTGTLASAFLDGVVVQDELDNTFDQKSVHVQTLLDSGLTVKDITQLVMDSTDNRYLPNLEASDLVAKELIDDEGLVKNIAIRTTVDDFSATKRGEYLEARIPTFTGAEQDVAVVDAIHFKSGVPSAHDLGYIPLVTVDNTVDGIVDYDLRKKVMNARTFLSQKLGDKVGLRVVKSGLKATVKSGSKGTVYRALDESGLRYEAEEQGDNVICLSFPHGNKKSSHNPTVVSSNTVAVQSDTIKGDISATVTLDSNAQSTTITVKNSLGDTVDLVRYFDALESATVVYDALSNGVTLEELSGFSVLANDAHIPLPDNILLDTPTPARRSFRRDSTRRRPSRRSLHRDSSVTRRKFGR